MIHAAIVGGSVSAAIATSDTGGASSPARFLLMLAVVYTAYFFPAREAWPYLGLVLVLHAAPLAYDRDSGLDDVLGELMILAPCYWLLAYLLICGKRGMVAAQTQADRLARLDPLTGLANRRALLEAIEAEPGRVGLLMLDVDDFKRVNTLHGHPGGDRALQFVAECLRARLPGGGSRGAAGRRRVRGARARDLAGRDGGARRAPDGARARGRIRCGSARAGSSARPTPISCSRASIRRSRRPSAAARTARSATCSGRSRGRGRAVVRSGRPRCGAALEQLREALAAPGRDLEHRADEDAVHACA